jgi:hypothetical protein
MCGGILLGIAYHVEQQNKEERENKELNKVAKYSCMDLSQYDTTSRTVDSDIDDSFVKKSA